MEKLELSKKYTSCHKTGKKRTLCSSQARNTKSFSPCFVARNILILLLISMTGHNENNVSTRTKEKCDHNSLNLKSKDFIISVYVITRPSKMSNFGQNDFIERTKLK